MSWKTLLMKNPNDVWKNAGRESKVKDLLTPRRVMMVEGLKATIKQLQSKEENPKRGWYSMKAGIARVTVKAGNRLVTVEGEQYNAIPAERAMDFYKSLLEDADKGNLDSAITAAFEGTSQPDVQVKARKPSAGWSDERRAKQAATIAARLAL